MENSQRVNSSKGQHKSVIDVNTNQNTAGTMVHSSSEAVDIDILKQQLDEKTKKISKLSLEYHKVMSDFNTERQETSRLNRELNALESELKLKKGPDPSLREENDRLKRELDNIKTENPQPQSEDENLLKRQLEEKIQKICQLSKDYNTVTNDFNSERLENKRLNRELRELKSEMNLTVQKESDSSLRIENDRLKYELDNMKIENTDLKSEVDHLRTSLSRLAGDKISDDNPYITDLSDPNRPQRLAEKFNKLYDDFWTDAFEILSSYGDEKKTCQFLLNILKVAARSHDIKVLKDARRSFTSHFIPYLCDYYWNTLGDISKNTSLKPYVSACIELSWHSAISEPPIDFIFDADKVEDFRAYTKKGNEVDYVVWPAMRLHKGGPTLYQGVVQLKQSGKK